MPIAFPLHIDRSGRTASADLSSHIQQLIEQVLFTMPGERVNRPGFGSGIMQLVFAGAGDELITAVEYLVQGALHQWLGELIQVENLCVEQRDSTLSVTVLYTVRLTQQRRVAELRRELAI